MSNIQKLIKKGDFMEIQDLLKRDSSIVNEWDGEFNTPLLMIFDGIDQNSPVIDVLALVQLLIDYGANVNAKRGVDSSSALHLAIRKQQFDTVVCLIKNGADLNCMNDFGYSPLHEAAKVKNTIFVELLLKNSKVNINQLGRGTPLNCALNEHQLNNAKILINAGAKIFDIYDSILKSYEENIDEFHFKINYGQKMDFFQQFSLEKMLDYKKFLPNFYKDCYRKITKAKKLLREYNVDLKTKQKIPPLHDAVENLNEDRLKFLLDSGSDVNSKDSNNNTPLHSLFANHVKDEFNCNRKTRIAKILIDRGADIRARNHININSFELAVLHNCKEIIDLMLDALTGIDRFSLREKLSYQPIQSCYYCKYSNLRYKISAARKTGLNELVVHLSKIINELNQNRHIFKVWDIPLFYFSTEGIHWETANIELTKFQRYQLFIPITYGEFFLNRFQVLCLLWQLNDNQIINELITHGLCSISKNLFTIIDREITYVSVFHYAIKLRMKKLTGDFLSMNGLFKINSELLSILNSCNEKLDKLEKTIICNDTSVFDIVIMSQESLNKFLNDTENFNAVNELLLTLENKLERKKYEEIVLVHISLAVERRIYFNIARKFLDSVFQKTLEKNTNYCYFPDNILSNILKNLSIVDLREISSNNQLHQSCSRCLHIDK